jgi:hypothetical protein
LRFGGDDEGRLDGAEYAPVFLQSTEPGRVHLDIDGMVLASLNEAVEQAHVAAELAMEMADGPTEAIFEMVLQATVPFRSAAMARDRDQKPVLLP